MRIFRFGGPIPALLAAALAAQAVPAGAQLAPSDPASVLAQSLKQLSSSPKDIRALMAAGRASLEMGDVQAAAGFFGRAEDSYPNSPLPKIGMGASLALTGDAPGAMAQFARAQALGAPVSMIALDRGLAYDLMGQQASAQADYRMAMYGEQADEARRRLALSQAISRDFKGAASTLSPLLNRGDQAALRTNAFVLALAGDPVAARRTIDAAMPGTGAGMRFEPFFKMLPILRSEEKAAAVHLGEFPQDAAQRYAQAAPVATSPTVTLGRQQIVSTTPALGSRAAPPVRKVAEAAPKPRPEAPRETRRSDPGQGDSQQAVRALRGIDRLGNPIYGRRTIAARQVRPAVPKPAAPALGQSRPVKEAEEPDPGPAPGFTLPSQVTAPEPKPVEAIESVPVETVPVELVSVETAPVTAALTPAPASDELLPLPTGETQMAANDTAAAATLAEAAPPAPTPKIEITPPLRSKPKVEGPSKAQLAAEKKKKEAAAAALAEKKAKEKEKAAAAKIGTSGTYWVQLAGGSNPDRMGNEFKRISGKEPSLFRGRTAHVTAGKDYFRLLVGPFKSPDDAHAFVTKLDKAGIDSFMWTRNPAQIRIDKLASK